LSQSAAGEERLVDGSFFLGLYAFDYLISRNISASILLNIIFVKPSDEDSINACEKSVDRCVARDTILSLDVSSRHAVELPMAYTLAAACVWA
jgi:hypothetical protein